MCVSVISIRGQIKIEYKYGVWIWAILLTVQNTVKKKMIHLFKKKYLQCMAYDYSHSCKIGSCLSLTWGVIFLLHVALPDDLYVCA